MRLRIGDRKGFSLLEVLVSLSLASLVLGSIMSGFCKNIQFVARMGPRYRNLLVASGALEKCMASRKSGELTEVFNGVTFKMVAGSVPSDPRIDSVTCSVAEEDPGQGADVTAYRLRVVTSENSGE